MKILILNEKAAPEGGEMNRYVLDVAARLRAAGETVAMVHGRLPKSEFHGTGYIFDHLAKMNATKDEVRTRLEAILDDFSPDIIQIHGAPNLGLDPWLAARAPTVRWVHNHRFYCSGQGMSLKWPRRVCPHAHGFRCLVSNVVRGCGSWNPLQNFLRHRQVGTALSALRKVSGIQVASHLLKETLVANGIDADRIAHIPLYAPPPTEPKKASPNPRRVILHFGGLVKHKGVWLLVHNIDRLPEDVEILFAGGGGDLQPALEEYVAHQNLSSRIRIMGEVNPAQASQLFHQAALVVMPSLWNEPLGLAGLHAMAHGKPIVAFRNSGVDEWLEDGQTGIAVPFGERESFIEAVDGLLRNPERLQQLGAQARETWNLRFRPEHHLEKLRSYYASLLPTSPDASL